MKKIKLLKNFFTDILSVMKSLFIIYLPLFSFYIFLLAFTGMLFFEGKKDVTIYLSVGFGMLIALASICFSYLKTMEEAEIERKKIIKTCGESFLMTGLSIMIAISLQFASVHLSAQQSVLILFLGKIFHWLSFITIITVLTYFAVAFSKLFHMLFFQVDKDIRNL